MKSFPIPVRSIGPGSQPTEDDTLAVLDMPRDVSTFQMPRVPERVDPLALAAARDLLQQWHDRLRQWDPAAQPQGPQLDLAGTPAAVLSIVNDMLGEGEVVIRIAGEPEWAHPGIGVPGFLALRAVRRRGPGGSRLARGRAGAGGRRRARARGGG